MRRTGFLFLSSKSRHLPYFFYCFPDFFYCYPMFFYCFEVKSFLFSFLVSVFLILITFDSPRILIDIVSYLRWFTKRWAGICSLISTFIGVSANASGQVSLTEKMLIEAEQEDHRHIRGRIKELEDTVGRNRKEGT